MLIFIQFTAIVQLNIEIVVVKNELPNRFVVFLSKETGIGTFIDKGETCVIDLPHARLLLCVWFTYACSLAHVKHLSAISSWFKYKFLSIQTGKRTGKLLYPFYSWWYSYCKKLILLMKKCWWFKKF